MIPIVKYIIVLRIYIIIAYTKELKSLFANAVIRIKNNIILTIV